MVIETKKNEPKMMKNIGVFCGSRHGLNAAYQQAAVEMGTFLAQENLTLVYGGGRLGLMGLTASTVLQNNGHVVGVIPEHLDNREGAFHEATELYIVDNMHTRKMTMSERADAFVILPGGFGTMDEFFEILTWRQLTLHHKPIYVLNIDGYWSPLEDLFKHIIRAHFADAAHSHYVRFCSSTDELFDAMKADMALLKNTP